MRAVRFGSLIFVVACVLALGGCNSGSSRVSATQLEVQAELHNYAAFLAEGGHAEEAQQASNQAAKYDRILDETSKGAQSVFIGFDPQFVLKIYAGKLYAAGKIEESDKINDLARRYRKEQMGNFLGSQ